MWELAPRLRKLNKQRLPKQKEKDLTVNDVDKLPKHLLLQLKTQRVEEEASSSRPMKRAKENAREKENKAAIQQRGRTRNLHGENHRVQHGGDGAALTYGAVLGQPQHHGGNSKDDDIERY